MHKVCAEFSAHHCPFLDGRHTEHSERPLPVVRGRPIMRHENIAPRRPEKMCLMRATTKADRIAAPGVLVSTRMNATVNGLWHVRDRRLRDPGLTIRVELDARYVHRSHQGMAKTEEIGPTHIAPSDTFVPRNVGSFL